MKNIKFTNEEQFVNEWVVEIIKVHMNNSNSLKCLPSECLDVYQYTICETYLEAHKEKFANIEDPEKKEEKIAMVKEFDIIPLCKKIKRLADAKWQAMMLLLGVE